MTRRDLVLSLMRKHGMLSGEEYRTAVALPVKAQLVKPDRAKVTNLHRIEGGGTEFPMVTMNGSPSLGLMVHETAHIYVHGLLASKGTATVEVPHDGHVHYYVLTWVAGALLLGGALLALGAVALLAVGARWLSLAAQRPEANVSTLTTTNGNTVAQEIFDLVGSECWVMATTTEMIGRPAPRRLDRIPPRLYSQRRRGDFPDLTGRAPAPAGSPV